jgi:hypothetical protein
MSDAIWVAIIGGGFGTLGIMMKVLLGLRAENRKDHRTVTQQLGQLITGHKHLDGRITEVREDVRDLRTDIRATNQRLDSHIHGTE